MLKQGSLSCYVDFSFQLALKHCSSALSIGFAVQAHDRLPDDNVCIASWLVTDLLGCRLRGNCEFFLLHSILHSLTAFICRSTNPCRVDGRNLENLEAPFSVE